MRSTYDLAADRAAAGIASKIIYIAGKITGDPDYREKFAAAEERLWGEGYIVLSPAWMPEGMTKADYMRICFAMIDISDAVYFLRDYRQSSGALVEWPYCRYIGKQIMYEDEAALEKSEK